MDSAARTTTKSSTAVTRAPDDHVRRFGHVVGNVRPCGVHGKCVGDVGVDKALSVAGGGEVGGAGDVTLMSSKKPILGYGRKDELWTPKPIFRAYLEVVGILALIAAALMIGALGLTSGW